MKIVKYILPLLFVTALFAQDERNTKPTQYGAFIQDRDYNIRIGLRCVKPDPIYECLGLQYYKTIGGISDPDGIGPILSPKDFFLINEDMDRYIDLNDDEYKFDGSKDKKFSKIRLFRLTRWFGKEILEENMEDKGNVALLVLGSSTIGVVALFPPVLVATDIIEMPFQIVYKGISNGIKAITYGSKESRGNKKSRKLSRLLFQLVEKNPNTIIKVDHNDFVRIEEMIKSMSAPAEKK